MSGWLESISKVRSNDALSSFLDEMPVGILGTDGAGKILFANATAGSLLGRKPASLLGSDVAKVLGVAVGKPGMEQECAVTREDGTAVTLGVQSRQSPAGPAYFLRDLTDFAFLREGLLAAEHREQRRLAQVLHDQLSQQLLGAAFSAKMLAIQLERQNPPPSAAEMNDLARLINECGGQLREVTADPATRAAAEGDFPAALREMARQQRRAEVEIIASDESPIEIGRNTPIIFGLCREALNTAVAAGASKVTVLAHPRGNTVSVKIVSNDSTPHELMLEPPTAARRLFEFRCQAVGIQPTFHAGGGTGSTLTLSIPLQP